MRRDDQDGDGRREGISIHAPVKGATVQPSWQFHIVFEISIHAPVKGATKLAVIAGPCSIISIHAPVKGATSPGNFQALQRRYFNPRTREGCDAGDDVAVVAVVDISIHAPVKGATLSRQPP